MEPPTMSVAALYPKFYAPYKAEYLSYLVKRASELDYYRLEQFKQKITVGLPKPKTQKSDIEKKTEEIEQKIENLGNYTEDELPVKIGIIGAGISGLYTGYILQTLRIDYEILEASDRCGGRIRTHHFDDTDDRSYYDVGAMRFPDTPIMTRTFDLFKRMGLVIPEKPKASVLAKGSVDPSSIPSPIPTLIPLPIPSLISYIMDGENCPIRYNDITAIAVKDETNRTEYVTSCDPLIEAKPNKDPFRVSTANGGPVPISRASLEAGKEILNDAYDRFRQKIKNAVQAVQVAEKGNDQQEKDDAQFKLERAFDYLMRHDKYSMRDYLMNVEGYDAETVHWLETTDSASGWFNEAFSENVLESLAFDYDSPSAEPTKTTWYCVLGGTIKVVDAMIPEGSILKSKIKKNHWVTKISLVDPKKPTKPKDKETTAEKTTDKKTTDEKTTDEKTRPKDKETTDEKSTGEKSTGEKTTVKDTRKALRMKVDYNVKDPDTKVKPGSTEYSAVINTTTLGALQKIDLTDLALPFGMKTAIRVLRYDSSTKVGIRFKKMWWRDAKFLPDRAIKGGVAKTDMPLRVCVYPSYNISDDPKADAERPGVLLASYTWGQDAERVASHISSTSPENEEELIRLMMYNLARLHTLSLPTEDYDERFKYNLEYITSLYDRHHAYDWSKDPHAAGAFALFSPGQFSTLVPYLVRPAADSRFVIIGEHASANHAWIVGALDSAVRGLQQVFTRLKMTEELKELGKQFKFVGEIKAEEVTKQVLLGRADQDVMDASQIGRQLVPANVNAFP